VKKLLLIALGLTSMAAASAQGADVLWYTGHSGYDDGHLNIEAILSEHGAVFETVEVGPLPVLDDYLLIYICLPGFSDPADFFSPDEIDRLNIWLGDLDHQLVVLGDWEGFYQGQAVAEHLLAGLGTPWFFLPGGWDAGCDHCAGEMGDPHFLTEGVDHICHDHVASIGGGGVPLAYPEDPAAPGPWVVATPEGSPQILLMGDSHATTDLCAGHLGTSGDLDSITFHRRQYKLGVCCLLTGECIITTAEHCRSLGGRWVDDGISCDPNPCDEAVGACCIAGDCYLAVSETECAAMGGIWMPDNFCDPSPCGTTPIESGTWGKIKSLYH